MFSIVNLKGEYISDRTEPLVFVLNDKLFISRQFSCYANAVQLVADYLGVQKDGEFEVNLYQQQTLKSKRQFLKDRGFKAVSSLNMAEVDKLIQNFFLLNQKETEK